MVLKKNQIASIDVMQCDVRYAMIEGKLLMCADDVFSCVFGDSKYSHISAVKNTGDADGVEDKTEFFDIFRINERLYDYNLTANRYNANPEKYQYYIDFLNGGGLNSVVQAIEQKTSTDLGLGELPVKNIDYLNASVKKMVDVAEVEQVKAKVEEKQRAIEELEKQLDTLKTEHLQSINIKEESQKVKTELEKVRQANKQLSDTLNRIKSDKATIEQTAQCAVKEVEGIKATSQKQVEQIETLTQILAEKEVTLRESQEQIQQLKNEVTEVNVSWSETLESKMTDLAAKAEAEKQKAVAAVKDSYKRKEQNRDRLRELLTGKRIWLRLAIFVIAIFLPFTFMAVWKYIAIPTPNLFSTLAVGALCLAIAFVWDAAILVFAVNGKKKMAAFGSVFQFVFFSAKFDYLAKIFNVVGDGMYWQEFIVITCAVIYSPLLVWQVTELATKNDNNNQNITRDNV